MLDLLSRLIEMGRPKTAVGYRGIRNQGESGHGVTGTEGNGVYIADTQRLAEFFGDVHRIEYIPPSNPMIVDEEPLYLLQEMDELFEPINDDDSPWTKANKEAIKRSGVTNEHWSPEKVAAALTDIIKEMDHDGVRVTSGGESWTVLFDPKAIISQQPVEERVDEGCDKRYAKWVIEHHKELERRLASYNSGEAIASAEDGIYRVEIHPDHQTYFILKSNPDKPVPAGNWMNFWDEDLKKVLGITKDMYDKLSVGQRAKADATVQLKKWVGIEYWMLYAEMYHVSEYDKWWWDEGGAGYSAKSGIKATNEYWKKRLNRKPVANSVGRVGEAKLRAIPHYGLETAHRVEEMVNEAEAEAEDFNAGRRADLSHYRKGNNLVSVENDEYRVEIQKGSYRYFIFNKKIPNKPVPTGIWMGFWDDDIEKITGLDMKTYDSLPEIEQAKADAKVQLEKYVPKQFWNQYAEFYYPEEYKKHGRTGSWVERNKYWKKRLNKDVA